MTRTRTFWLGPSVDKADHPALHTVHQRELYGGDDSAHVPGRGGESTTCQARKDITVTPVSGPEY